MTAENEEPAFASDVNAVLAVVEDEDFGDRTSGVLVERSDDRPRNATASHIYKSTTLKYGIAKKDDENVEVAMKCCAIAESKRKKKTRNRFSDCSDLICSRSFLRFYSYSTPALPKLSKLPYYDKTVPFPFTYIRAHNYTQIASIP